MAMRRSSAMRASFGKSGAHDGKQRLQIDPILRRRARGVGFCEAISPIRRIQASLATVQLRAISMSRAAAAVSAPRST